MHPLKVEVNAGGKLTAVSADGTTTTDGEAEGRGVVIKVFFWGECNHYSVLRLEFCLDHTRVDIESFGEMADFARSQRPIGRH
jgi:hypothetical protein